MISPKKIKELLSQIAKFRLRTIPYSGDRHPFDNEMLVIDISISGAVQFVIDEPEAKPTPDFFSSTV